MTRARGLAVSNIMCWRDLVSGDAASLRSKVKTLKECVSAAGELDVPVMNVFTGPMSWNPGAARIGKEVSEGAAWRRVVESLSDVLETAEAQSVTLTVEPVFGMLVHDYYTVRELMGQVDSRWLGVNLDPSHFAVSGNDVPWAARMLGPKVRHVHVKDAFGRPSVFGETFTFPFLGEGVVDWTGFFQALAAVGYRGFLSLEFENDVYLKNVCGGDWSAAAVQLKERADLLLRRAFLRGKERRTRSGL
jgi:sugar phosphate isomerase/epimerase